MGKKFQLKPRGESLTCRNTDENELRDIFTLIYAKRNKVPPDHPQALEAAFNSIETIKAASPQVIHLTDFTDVCYA